jgi:hypothetical protein
VLEGASAGAYVWYYLCAHCKHVWSVDKKDATKVAHVTPLRGAPKTNEERSGSHSGGTPSTGRHHDR